MAHDRQSFPRRLLTRYFDITLRYAKTKLTEQDIEYYQKIVVAIRETIRLMGEIDAVIERHGGWPDAFITESVPLNE